MQKTMKIQLRAMLLLLLLILAGGNAWGQAVYTPPAASTIGDIKTLPSRFAPLLKNGGYYNPSFQSTTMLEGVAGTWAIGGTGGLKTNTPGSSALGVIRLPTNIDVEKPFRVDFLVEYLRTPSRQAIVGLGDTSNANVVSGNIGCGVIVTGITNASPAVLTTQFAHGLSTGDSITVAGATGLTAINGTWTVTRLSTTTFSVALDTTASGTYTANSATVDVGNLGMNNIFSPIADGELVCFSIAGANGVITSSAHVLGTNPQSYTVTNAYKTFQYSTQASNALANSKPVGSKFDRIYMRSFGARIIGVFVNPNGWDGPPDSRMATRTVVANHRQYDPQTPDLSIIAIPSRASFKTPQEIVIGYHQNLGNQTSWCYSSNTATGLDAGGATCRALLDAGYLWISSNGMEATQGTNANTPACNAVYGFGNGVGIHQAKRLLESVQANITNPAVQVNLLGMSMGGANCLNTIRMFPGIAKAVYIVQGVTDLNETGLRGAPASLSSALDTAYASYYVSIAAANLNNAPGDTTFWRPISAPGGQPFDADRLPAFTTVTTGAISATHTLGSTVGLLPGQKMWFQILREWRTIKSITSSTVAVFDLSISTTTGEGVAVQCPGSSTQWQARAIWSSATTYAIGDIVMVASSNAGVDAQSSNPLRTPELYIGIPIKHRYNASGDGTLNAVQATAFATAVNALTGGNVTNVSVVATHLADAAFSASDTVAFFNLYK